VNEEMKILKPEIREGGRFFLKTIFLLLPAPGFVMLVITAARHPTDASQVLLACRAEGSSIRHLLPAPRAVRDVVVVSDDGSIQLLPGDPSQPIVPHGARRDSRRFYPLSLAWRVDPVHELPRTAPDWLVCAGLAVWRAGVAAVGVFGRNQVRVFGTLAHALEWLYALGADIVFAMTPEAVHALEAQRTTLGHAEFRRRVPVLCDPDQFIRGANINRTPEGEPVFYRAPLLFVPPADAHPLRVREVATHLFAHREQWIAAVEVIPMMFALSALSGLPLHETAVPQQTALADALIECTWLQAPTEVPPPELMRGQDAEDEEKFKGGGVLEATLGFSEWVYHPDVRSLYPNCTREFLGAEYPLLARLFGQMIDLRAAESDPVRKRGYKTLTNAVFGSRLYGLYRNRVVAEKITAAGRQVQRESLQRLAAWGYATLVAGDTDSLAVMSAMRSAQYSDAFRNELVERLNTGRAFVLYNTTVDVYSRMLFISDKSWAGVRHPSGDIVTRGFMQNRSTTPAFLLPAHREWTQRMLCDHEFDPVRWLEITAKTLVSAQHPLGDLVVWPKPTNAHTSSDRGYFVVAPTREHVPYAEYMDSAHEQLPVDVAYLVEMYFTAELRRHLVAVASARK